MGTTATNKTKKYKEILRWQKCPKCKTENFSVFIKKTFCLNCDWETFEYPYITILQEV